MRKMSSLSVAMMMSANNNDPTSPSADRCSGSSSSSSSEVDWTPKHGSSSVLTAFTPKSFSSATSAPSRNPLIQPSHQSAPSALLRAAATVGGVGRGLTATSPTESIDASFSSIPFPEVHSLPTIPHSSSTLSPQALPFSTAPPPSLTPSANPNSPNFISISSISASFLMSPAIRPTQQQHGWPHLPTTSSYSVHMRCGEWSAKTDKVKGHHEGELICAAWSCSSRRDGNGWKIPSTSATSKTSARSWGFHRMVRRSTLPTATTTTSTPTEMPNRLSAEAKAETTVSPKKNGSYAPYAIEFELCAHQLCRRSRVLAKMFIATHELQMNHNPAAAIAGFPLHRNIDFGFGILDVVFASPSSPPFAQSPTSSAQQPPSLSPIVSCVPPPTNPINPPQPPHCPLSARSRPLSTLRIAQISTPTPTTPIIAFTTVGPNPLPTHDPSVFTPNPDSTLSPGQHQQLQQALEEGIPNSPSIAWA